MAKAKKDGSGSKTKGAAKSKSTTKSAPPALPPLLVEVAAWIESQPDHALGYFELSAEPITLGFEDPAMAARFAAHAVPFARIADGSEICVVTRGAGVPPAVVLLDSEGGDRTIATSPEAFALAWAEAETGVFELDDDDATARPEFAAWLEKKGVRDPDGPAFDLGAFLENKQEDAEGNAGAPTPPPADLARYAELPEHARRLALLLGRRGDDPELVAFVADLKKKAPASVSWSDDSQWVEAGKKHGIDLLFEAHVYHDAYPEIAKSKTSFVPYLAAVFFRPAYDAPLPYGLSATSEPTEVEAKLGPPSGTRGHDPARPFWQRSIDPGRGVVFDYDHYDEEPKPSFRIDAARELTTPAHPGKSIVGLFAAWAIARGLLDTTQFPSHADLIARVKARQATGEAFVDAALGRGLWDRHLVDRPGLWDFVYGWFHNIGDRYIRDDLMSVFGSRTGKHGHDEPVLDQATWEAVDRAAPALDDVFSKWRLP
jgi:hypothetical protein